MAEAATLQECTAASTNPDIAQTKPCAKPWLVKYRITPERSKALRPLAVAARIKNKALRAVLAQGCQDPEAIRLEQVKAVRAKLKRKGITAAEYAGWMRNLRDLGGLPPRKEDRSKPEPSQTGPIKPLV